ncbi:MAG: hypothetical protein P8J45_11380 [Phycisphaerales bacterium]|nr:hypothetical protein [Phycisphaerales bacterium]
MLSVIASGVLTPFLVLAQADPPKLPEVGPPPASCYCGGPVASAH